MLRLRDCSTNKSSESRTQVKVESRNYIQEGRLTRKELAVFDLGDLRGVSMSVATHAFVSIL